MFCRTCGNQIPDNSTICTSCGVPTGLSAPPQQLVQQQPQQYMQPQYNRQPVPYDPNAKSKMTAGLLGIFLGGWGVHRFYLGHVGIGIAQIFVTLGTCGIGALWGLIEGILILTGNIHVDAEGRQLRE